MILAAKLQGISVASAILLSACGNSQAIEETPASFAAEDWADARAKFISPNASPIGDALFKQAPGGVLMRVKLVDLTTGWHGVHLHQIGDCSDRANGFKASGGHVNPDGREHGLLNPNGHERADLPNIFAGADGRATAAFFAPGLSLSEADDGAQNSLYNLLDADGFAVVVHTNADDHMTQPIGGAGARIACAAVNKSG